VLGGLKVSSKNKTISYAKTSLFMLYLILSLTIVPVMNANAILKVDISGQDAVKGFRRLNDTTIINAYSDTIPVKIVGSSSKLNMTCAPAPTTGYRCNYAFPEQTQKAGMHTLNFAKETGEPPQLLKEYYVDDFDPSFDDVSYRQSGSEVIANFKVVDKVSRSISDKCSGLESVSLMVNGNVVAQKNLSDCLYQGSLRATVPGLEGETDLYLVAKDKLGNTGSSQSTLMNLDTTAPVISSSFSLLINGKELSAFSTESAVSNRVDVKITVSELSLKSLEADVSGISSLEGDVKKANCRPVNGKYECLIRDVLLNPESGDISIVVTAEDSKGNVDSVTLNKELEMINEGPRVIYLGSADPVCEDKCFVKEGGNKVLARIEAPGGLNANGVFFNFNGRVYPSTCNMTGSWECTANVNLDNSRSGSVQVLKITSNSMDDLGNLVGGITSKDMIVDNTKPKFLEKPTTDVNCPTAGQELRVTAKVDEEYSSRVIIKANTSLVSSSDFISNECTKTGDNEFDCLLVINNFMSTPTDGAVDVPISIYDLAGNTVNMILRMEVCRADNDVPPNFIRKITVDDDLPLIDKRIASLIPFRVDVPLTVDYARRTNNGRVSLNKVTAINCNEAWVSGPSTMMRETSANPSLSTYLFYQGVWPKKDVNISCSIDYRMREGNVVYLKPETENVNFTLSAIGEEIGNPGDAVIKKKKVLVKEIMDLQDEIESKKKIDDSLGKACSLAENIGMVNTMMQTVKALLYSVAVSLSWSTLGEAIWTEGHVPFDGFNDFTTEYIWPQGWFPIGTPKAHIGWIVKWICSIYTCKIYDASAIASLGSQIALNSDWGKELTRNNVEVPKKNGKIDAKLKESLQKDFQKDFQKDYGVSAKDLAAKLIKNDAVNLENVFKQRVHDQALSSNEGQAQGIASWMGGNWIINPYKNQAYDGLCFPAQLYNAQKEKQLKCLHLKCIDAMSTRGLPIDLCDEQADVLECLYVEGAKSRTQSGTSMLLKGLMKAALLSAVNFGITIAYVSACPEYYYGLGAASFYDLPKGGRSVACGLVGTVLSAKELIAYFNNPWFKYDNSLSTQYCSGLDAYGITSGDDN